jgi:hypothetical protein
MPSCLEQICGSVGLRHEPGCRCRCPLAGLSLHSPPPVHWKRAQVIHHTYVLPSSPPASARRDLVRATGSRQGTVGVFAMLPHSKNRYRRHLKRFCRVEADRWYCFLYLGGRASEPRYFAFLRFRLLRGFAWPTGRRRSNSGHK